LEDNKTPRNSRRKCSFCGRSENEVGFLITGMNGCICDSCSEQAYEIMQEAMQFINSDVATICTGMAASMAAVLLVAGTEGKRSALTHSRVMIHQPMGGAQGQASDIEITAREIQKLKKELYTIIADHSHTDFDKVWADSDRDYWMTAQEAKEYGMIDEVLSRKPAAL
jgi:ATP-dependent Clp protease, protease subunit